MESLKRISSQRVTTSVPSTKYLFIEGDEGGDAQTGLLQVLDALLSRVDRIDDDVVEGTARRRYGAVVLLIDGAEIAQTAEDAG